MNASCLRSSTEESRASNAMVEGSNPSGDATVSMVYNWSMLSDTKITGTVGELAVARHLIANGFDVFLPVGDASRVDLVAISPSGRTISMQIKTITDSSKGSVGLGTTRWHLKHSKRVRYTSQDVDFMVCYVIDRDKVGYVPMSAFAATNSLTLRFEPPKNGQKKSVHYFSEYENLPV